MSRKYSIEPVFPLKEKADPFRLYIEQDDRQVAHYDLTKLEVLKLINSGLSAFIGMERNERER